MSTTTDKPMKYFKIISCYDRPEPTAVYGPPKPRIIKAETEDDAVLEFFETYLGRGVVDVVEVHEQDFLRQLALDEKESQDQKRHKHWGELAARVRTAQQAEIDKRKASSPQASIEEPTRPWWRRILGP